MRAADHQGKDIPLEALRGLAALAVLVFHLLLSFRADLALQGSWWHGAVNGHAAVLLFFVLSGFVLTRRALATGDGRILARGALKRWPRLAAPILLSVLFSWALLRLGAMHHVEAGTLAGSGWLRGFGDAQPDGPVQPSLAQAVLQGGVFALFRGEEVDRTYNTVLWTMRYEFLGSFIAFAMALALIQLRAASLAVRLGLVALVALTVRFAEVYYLTFVLGVGLALFVTARRVRLPGAVAGAMVLLGLYLLGYREGSADHAWMEAIYRRTPSETYVHAAAAALLILAIEGSATLRARLSGAWAVLLGRLSFALYLLHVPVLCSAGAAAYLALGGGMAGALVASGVTVVATFALSVPLARFDVWWTRLVGRVAARIVPDPAPAARAPAPAVAEGGMGAGWAAAPQPSERKTA
ncbi:MAG TPA: acyltransferase [Acetobacteraceae bacterium]|nr:acyltransferase [Acetobacteraceae bacterium]